MALKAPAAGVLDGLPFFLRRSLSHFMAHHRFLRSNLIPSALKETLSKNSNGLFVTLYLRSVMRGCSGTKARGQTLFQDLQYNAVRAAFYDKRLMPITFAEIDLLEFEVIEIGEIVSKTIRSRHDLMAQLEDGFFGIVFRCQGRGTVLLPGKLQSLSTSDAIELYLLKKAGLDGMLDYEKIWIGRFQCSTLFETSVKRG